MIALEDSPSRASTEPKQLGSRVDCNEPRSGECITELPILYDCRSLIFISLGPPPFCNKGSPSIVMGTVGATLVMDLLITLIMIMTLLPLEPFESVSALQHFLYCNATMLIPNAQSSS